METWQRLEGKASRGHGAQGQLWLGAKQGAEGHVQDVSSPIDEGLILTAVVLDLEHPHGVRWPPWAPAHQP